MRPKPAAFMPGSNACMHWKAQRRFNDTARSNSASVWCSASAGTTTPTLLTSRVMGPLASASCSARAVSAASDRSARMAPGTESTTRSMTIGR